MVVKKSLHIAKAVKPPGTITALPTLTIFLEFKITRKPCSSSFSEPFMFNSVPQIFIET